VNCPVSKFSREKQTETVRERERGREIEEEGRSEARAASVWIELLGN